MWRCCSHWWLKLSQSWHADEIFLESRFYVAVVLVNMYGYRKPIFFFGGGKLREFGRASFLKSPKLSERVAEEFEIRKAVKK